MLVILPPRIVMALSNQSFRIEGLYSVLFSRLLLSRQSVAGRVHLLPLASEAAFSFSQMLAAVLLLLQLWGSGRQETDNERAAQGTSAPLLPLLQRFRSMARGRDAPHAEADAHVSATATPGLYLAVLFQWF